MGMKVHMKIIVFTVLAALVTGCSFTYLSQRAAANNSTRKPFDR